MRKFKLNYTKEMLDDIAKLKGMNEIAEKIAIKKKELKELKELHKSMWDDYGSELSAGFMVRKEEELEKEIKLLEDNGENLNVV